jgi:hypothetical protein
MLDIQGFSHTPILHCRDHELFLLAQDLATKEVVEKIPCGPTDKEVLAQGKTQGSTLQKCTNKTLTTSPFSNTCEADEVSSEEEAGVVARIRYLQP